MFAELTGDDLKEHFLMLSFPDRKRLLGMMTELNRNERPMERIVRDTIPAKSSHASDDANCETAFVKGVKTGLAKRRWPGGEHARAISLAY